MTCGTAPMRSEEAGRDVGAALSAAIVLALLFAACDRNPRRPTPVPGAPSVVRLEVTGPGSIAPGGAEQFRATAHMSDGSQRDVTTEAAWNSANASIISISSAGLATAHDRGEADIRVAFSEVMSTKRVMVLPRGTFKVSGQGARRGGRRDRCARRGSCRVRHRTLDTQPGWRLRLVWYFRPDADSGFEEGYQPRIENLDVTDHRTLDIGLALVRPPWIPSGKYTLTIAAAPQCRAALPEDVWHALHSGLEIYSNQSAILECRT